MRLDCAIEEFLVDRRAAGRSPATIRWYGMHLRRLANFLSRSPTPEVEDITRSDLRHFMAHLQDQNLSPHTLRGIVRTLRIFFKWCVVERLCSESPALYLPMPKADDDLPRCITLDEIKAMLEAVEAPPSRGISPRERHRLALRDRAIILFLADTGCRAGELLGLRMSELNVEAGQALVLGKGHKRRFVFFGDCVKEAMQAYLEAWPAEDHEPVFRGRKGPLSYRGLVRLLKRIGERAGVENCHPHAFRHGFAAERVRRGIDLRRLRDLMGHASVQTTERYGRFRTDDLREAHRQTSFL